MKDYIPFKLYTDKKNYLSQALFSEENSTKKEVPSFNIKIDKRIPLYGDVLIRFKNNGLFINIFF